MSWTFARMLSCVQARHRVPRSWLRVLAASTFVALIAATPALAEVRVEEDEVIFSIVAPGASEVFLVGDFNNWNATMEKMRRTGDRFEVRLFMLAGTYRYGFVVDGRMVSDPDNPPAGSQRGSPLVLEERGGALVLATDVLEPGEEAPALDPSARFRGAYAFDEGGETSSEPSFDVYLTFDNEHLRAMADVRTRDDLVRDVYFDRGFAAVQLGGARFVGFENDTVWTSADPFTLVGDVGIYDYNVGYERKGFTFEWPTSRLDLRALYTDKTGAQTRAPAASFGDFATSNAPDTVVYAFDTGAQDEDSWALDLTGNFGSVRIGYGHRNNRGLHPGTLAAAERLVNGFDVQVSNTHEEWDADVVWLEWGAPEHFDVTVGYGASDSHVRQNHTSTVSDSVLDEVTIGSDSETTQERVQLQTSDRWTGSLAYRNAGLYAALSNEWNRFDFRAHVTPASRAEINVAAVDVAYERGKWRAAGQFHYTDQDYGMTPADFHYRTPARNFWIDFRDRLDVHDIVGFDLPRVSDLSLSFALNPTPLSNRYATARLQPWSARVDAHVTGPKLLDGVAYWSLRAGGERRLRGGFYGQLDARVAAYDKESWTLDKTFYNLYVEIGYRIPRLEASLGFGFDDVVLDAVVNDYNDNGRREFLREVIPADLRRDQAAALGAALGEQEQRLEDLWSRIKLEVVFLF